jgi:hypothetical protein
VNALPTGVELAIVLHSHMPYVEGFLDVAARQGLRLARLD